MAAPELQQGTLDLLILKTLDAGPLHGWAISRRITQQSRDVLKVGQGSLYPALYRLEERGLAPGPLRRRGSGAGPSLRPRWR
jgi:DNA-binding PadR family transcriptional regulator